MNHAKRQQNARSKLKATGKRYLLLYQEYGAYLTSNANVIQKVMSNKHLPDPIDYKPILQEFGRTVRNFQSRLSNFKNQKTLRWDARTLLVGILIHRRIVSFLITNRK